MQATKSYPEIGGSPKSGLSLGTEYTYLCLLICNDIIHFVFTKPTTDPVSNVEHGRIGV